MSRERTSNEHACSTVPRLREIISSDCICESLRERVDFGDGIELKSARLERLWAGRRGRITFEYALDIVEHGRTSTHLLQGGIDGSVAGRESQETAQRYGKWIDRVCVDIPDIGLTFVSPSCDYTLPNPAEVAIGANHVLFGSPAPTYFGGTFHDFAELVAFRVNKRFVLRSREFDRQGNRTFIKALRRPLSTDSLHFWKRLSRGLSSRTAGKVKLPRIVAVDPCRQWYAVEGREKGSRAYGYHDRDANEAAKLLVSLHGLSPPSFACHTLENEIDILRRWEKVMHVLDLSNGPIFSQLIDRLENSIAKLNPGPATLVHRDFYSSQLMAEGDRTWLLDFDTFANGNAEVDVATYAAHLALDRLNEGCTATQIEEELPRFAEWYLSAGGELDSKRLDFYVASAIARMAAIHGQRRLPSEQVEALLDMANRYARRLDRLNGTNLRIRRLAV